MNPMCKSPVIFIAALWICAAQDGPEKIYGLKEPKSTPPSVIKKVEPNSVGGVGTVVLGIVISTSGEPEDIRVLSPVNPRMEEEAIRTVMKWRFRPGAIDGKPVAMRASIEVNFVRAGPDGSAFAKQEKFRGMHNLALAYRSGNGRDKDPKGAFELLLEVAGKGYAPSQAAVAEMYANGEGVDRDDKLAIEWARKAAAQYNPQAQLLIGGLLAAGRGAPRDPAAAAGWYLKAAQRGQKAAQVNLGFAYLDGTGVEKDERKAAHWFYKAADQGLPIAQYALGTLYAGGTGVNQDLVQALKWMRLAVGGGYAAASKPVDQLEKTMSPAQIRDAEKQIAAFKPASWR
ncbi:MAG: TonB family protein [Bryobacteraceae bacterium]